MAFRSWYCLAIGMCIAFSLQAKQLDPLYRLEDSQHRQFIKVEFISDEVVHFELGMVDRENSNWKNKIYTSPMVVSNLKYERVSVVRPNPYTLKTSRLSVFVNPHSLCVTTNDLISGQTLNTLCPKDLEKDWKGLVNFSSLAHNVYGLGQYFIDTNTAEGDWVGKVWDPAEYQGNSMRPFAGGANGYTQFPIAYFLGQGMSGYALFLDNFYRQKWDFTQKPFSIEMYGDQIRWFIIAGDSLKALRSRYMALTGTPPVPPKGVFGLFVSRFGFQNWTEVYEELAALRKNKIPVDGFALDLQWFGGRFYPPHDDVSSSQMGTLRFDERNFPSAKEVVRNLKEVHAIELMPIEEPYVSSSLPEFRQLARQTYLAHDCASGAPIVLRENPWWGVGGMLDWSNWQAAAYWHDKKREPLIQMGIHFHWTDLGEPEIYNVNACYAGVSELNLERHADIHNLYNLFWSRSIWMGYQRNQETLRPYIMSRSGTSGSQRFGVGMWSGDIASNMRALVAHIYAQKHVSLSGMDYYGSDVGGFHRSESTLDGDENELYTQWFANSALFDFPVRPHVWNVGQNKQTSPAKIGHKESNRANILTRYMLFPYYYSLAYEAYLHGQAIVAPLVYEFQDNLDVRLMGHQKMIGPFLMAAIVARYGEYERSVYFPKGTWFDFRTHRMYQGKNAYIEKIPTRIQGLLQLPLFVKEGAIIPVQAVDEATSSLKKALTASKYGANATSALRIYPSDQKSQFTLYEDDYQTQAYQEGDYAAITIEAQRVNKSAVVILRPKLGKYEKELSRSWKLDVHTGCQAVESVDINGEILNICEDAESKACFEQKNTCMMQVKTDVIKDVYAKQINIQFQ